MTKLEEHLTKMLDLTQKQLDAANKQIESLGKCVDAYQKYVEIMQNIDRVQQQRLTPPPVPQPVYPYNPMPIYYEYPAYRIDTGPYCSVSLPVVKP